MSREPSLYSLSISFMVLMLVIGMYGFFHSPFFSVESIQASGSSYTVEKLARVAGIEEGTSLLRLNVELAAKRLEEEPIIYRAIVRRHLPNLVFIEIEERTPVAMVPHGSEFWGVAVDGTVLGRVDIAGVSLPIITGVDASLLAIGRRNLSELVIATTMLEGLTPAIRDQISEVNVRERDGLRLVSRDLIEFYLGGPGQMGEKLQVVAAFLPRLGSTAAPSNMLVDVSNPNRPVVRKQP
ncbi:MAG: FtsQ-type POTRA domain-containing protein [Firmicutes bacterium]|nr:FtsQ-type POTRA domain-containing protein [Bacillota bacterium]